MQPTWQYGWLQPLVQPPPELAGVPGVRPYKNGFKIHRTHWSLLRPETQSTLPPPPATILDIPEGLRPYQKEAADFCASRRGSLLSLYLGAGKTRTALAAAGWGRGVVVSPLVAFGVWIKELQNVWGDVAIYDEKLPTLWADPALGPVEPANRVKVQVVRGHHQTGDKVLADADVYIVNPELLRTRAGTDLAGVQPDWAIFDEAHYYVNDKSQRSQGAAMLANCSSLSRTIALTGTPILKNLTNLYGIMSICCPGAFGSPTEFQTRYCGAQPGEYGLVLGEPSNVPELRQRLSEVMYAKAWHEVSTDIPPITRERCPLVLDSESRREYDRLANDIREVLKALETGSLHGAEKMQQVNMLRRLIGHAKVPAVHELIRSCGDEPVVVWTWHRDTAAEIAKPFKGAVVVTGAESRKKRDEKIERFKRGDSNLIVSTMSSSGFGIDLTRSRITIQAELSWISADMAQAEGRVFRTGQTRPCMTYWLVAEDTIETHIIGALWRKAGMASALGKSLETEQRMMTEVNGGATPETLRDKEIAESVMKMIEKSFDLVGMGEGAV